MLNCGVIAKTLKVKILENKNKEMSIWSTVWDASRAPHVKTKMVHLINPARLYKYYNVDEKMNLCLFVF